MTLLYDRMAVTCVMYVDSNSILWTTCGMSRWSRPTLNTCFYWTSTFCRCLISTTIRGRCCSHRSR